MTKDEYAARCRKWILRHLHVGSEVRIRYKNEKSTVVYIQERGCYFKVACDFHLHGYSDIANAAEIINDEKKDPMGYKMEMDGNGTT